MMALYSFGRMLRPEFFGCWKMACYYCVIRRSNSGSLLQVYALSSKGAIQDVVMVTSVPLQMAGPDSPAGELTLFCLLYRRKTCGYIVGPKFAGNL